VAAIRNVSGVYETDPFGYAHQPVFWNLALQLDSASEPERLIAELKALERRIGRQPTFRMGPRLIDIDVLLYGDRRIRSAQLEIPHAGLLDRRFVLRPLTELAPELSHPVTGVRLRDRLAELGDDGTVRRIGSAEEVLGDDLLPG
jgi:2-amino-4-hydroxy-6-hydroxymethyldihydropteridine diphosphokinase